jgi:hypothetical protein
MTGNRSRYAPLRHLCHYEARNPVVTRRSDEALSRLTSVRRVVRREIASALCASH